MKPNVWYDTFIDGKWAFRTMNVSRTIDEQILILKQTYNTDDVTIKEKHTNEPLT